MSRSDSPAHSGKTLSRQSFKPSDLFSPCQTSRPIVVPSLTVDTVFGLRRRSPVSCSQCHWWVARSKIESLESHKIYGDNNM